MNSKSQIHRESGPRCVRHGYALVSTLLLVSVLVLVSLSMLHLSSSTRDEFDEETHRSIARANARLALTLAISDLQNALGPDQRVCAEAALLGEVEHPHWLGVWKTTMDGQEGGDFPVIGKGDPSNTPYESSAYYSDQRDHGSQEWRKELLQSWLVSGDLAPVEKLTDPVTLVGMGSLGASAEQSEFVQVEKIKLNHGKYGWWIANDNLKADIGSTSSGESSGELSNELSDENGESDLALAVYEAADPEAIALDVTGKEGEVESVSFLGFRAARDRQQREVLSYRSLELTESSYKEALQLGYHDFTHHAEGLHVDVSLGALKRDLTPVLFAKPEVESLHFEAPDGRVFSTEEPMIAGTDHGVLGPSFAALRHWGLERYRSDYTLDRLPDSASRRRPSKAWPYEISDGVCADMRHWSVRAPKIQPVMTDCRWHFYFSHDGKGNIRTHIQPRVCLWNPYNRTIKTPEMTVLIPNPFYNGHGSLFFFLSDGAVETAVRQNPSNSVFTDWRKENYQGGLLGKGNTEAYQFRVKLEKGRVNSSLFPGSRFLAFTLEPSDFGHGECLVFLPIIENAAESAGGTIVTHYDTENPSRNRLSASSLPSEGHHFIHQMQGGLYQRHKRRGIRTLSLSDRQLLDFGEIFDYQINYTVNRALTKKPNFYRQPDNFAYVLKYGSAESYENIEYLPTMQLLLGGASGVASSSFHQFSSQSIGYAGSGSGGLFGNLETFRENPQKVGPNTHAFGIKLLWLDESKAEARGAPYRVNKWEGEHMAVNPASIANWNMRAHLVTRSPASASASHWAAMNSGAWMTQMNAPAPNDVRDQPIFENGKHKKNPFGMTQDYSASPDVILFDLPHPRYGALSLGALRHAQLSPYSWSPSYIIGNSLRDLHAPAQATAHREVTKPSPDTMIAQTRWDYLLGGFTTSGEELFEHGPRAYQLESAGLLQIGNEAASRTVNGQSYSSENELLAYDIAYEVNHNLWDAYFLSGLKLKKDGSAFRGDGSWNTNIIRTNYRRGSEKEIEDLLRSEDSLSYGFWQNAQHLSYRGMFNVNSVSVPAWRAFLSTNLAKSRPLAGGGRAEAAVSYSRYRRAQKQGDSTTVSPQHEEAWQGARQLTAEETKRLAEAIVAVVKERGPFLSMSDFINRRLAPAQREASRSGTLEHAIAQAELNAQVDSKFDTSTVDELAKGSKDNNLALFSKSYLYDLEQEGAKSDEKRTAQPDSKAWGLPGYMIQSDLLECLAPAMTVRGDSFTVRAYGESSSLGVIHAKAYLEARVMRSTSYLRNDQNAPTESALVINKQTGAVEKGNLSTLNERHGRRFQIISTRWLSESDI